MTRLLRVPALSPALSLTADGASDELEFLQAKDEYAWLLKLFETSGSAERRAVVVDVGGNNCMFALECARFNPAFTSIYSF